MRGLPALYTTTRINKNSGRLGLLRLCLILLTLAGCQSFAPFADRRLLEEQTFQHLWSLYSHCRSSVDPEEMREDLQHLGQAARRLRELNRAPFLPEAFAYRVEGPPSRLSVNPEAMMAACAIRAGQETQMTGRTDIATELYGFVLSGSWKSLSSYYAEQARSGLALLERTKDLASKNTDATTEGPLN